MNETSPANGHIRFFVSGNGPGYESLIEEITSRGAVRMYGMDSEVTHLLAGLPSSLEDKQRIAVAVECAIRLTSRGVVVTTGDPDVLSTSVPDTLFVATLTQMAQALRQPRLEASPSGMALWAPDLAGGGATAMPMFVGV